MKTKGLTFLRWSLISASFAVALVVGAAAPFSPRVLRAQSPQALEAQHQRLLPLFELDGVVFTDADETRGRFVVGVLNRGLETAIRARLQGLGIAQQSVDVVVTDPIVEVASLQDRVRPLVGGLQVRFDGYLCTYGFNADLVNHPVFGAVTGFLVNSHCTTNESTVDGTLYYQPLAQTAGDFIGAEILDPPFFQKTNGCPRGKVCRYSDAAFVQRDSAATATLGGIAVTNAPNNGSLEIAGTLSITSEAGANATVGTTLNKVGRTTGWTQGVVTNSCVNTGVSGSRIVRLCQDFVSAGVGGGDSSSAVFQLSGGSDVRLYGILWGGSSAGDLFVYSPLYRVKQELGQLTTH